MITIFVDVIVAVKYVIIPKIVQIWLFQIRTLPMVMEEELEVMKQRRDLEDNLLNPLEREMEILDEE